MVLELFLIHVCLQSSSLSVWDIWQSVAKIRKSPERDQGGIEDCWSSCYNSGKDWWWCFLYLLENCRMLNACFPSLASQFQYHLTWHKKHPDWHCNQFQWSPKIFCIFLPKLSLNTWLVSWLSCNLVDGIINSEEVEPVRPPSLCPKSEELLQICCLGKLGWYRNKFAGQHLTKLLLLAIVNILRFLALISRTNFIHQLMTFTWLNIFVRFLILIGIYTTFFSSD